MIHIVSTKSEKERLSLFKKVKKYRKELSPLFMQELNKPIETKLSNNDESDFDDDLSYKEEVEVIINENII